MGLAEVSGHGAGEDGRVALADQQAERPLRSQHVVDRGQRGAGVVDHLEHPVAEHDVDPGRRDQPGQRGEVALDAADPVGDAGLRRASGQRGEGVGAGVDHHHLVAELGHPTAKPPVPPPMSRTSSGPPPDRPSRGPRASQTTAVRAELRRW